MMGILRPHEGGLFHDICIQILVLTQAVIRFHARFIIANHIETMSLAMKSAQNPYKMSISKSSHKALFFSLLFCTMITSQHIILFIFCITVLHCILEPHDASIKGLLYLKRLCKLLV